MGDKKPQIINRIKPRIGEREKIGSVFYRHLVEEDPRRAMENFVFAPFNLSDYYTGELVDLWSVADQMTNFVCNFADAAQDQILSDRMSATADGIESYPKTLNHSSTNAEKSKTNTARVWSASLISLGNNRFGLGAAEAGRSTRCYSFGRSRCRRLAPKVTACSELSGRQLCALIPVIGDLVGNPKSGR